ncbi:DUF1488 domain-containing protein [Pantoea sp. 1.19]|uniref:DUF1488 domain-containing protein n=1 Tax=Pantoea sp. 1.19 TaxID=1925589 RepID=UPI0009491C13|nr:DUF1488 domain-containing protein [Pantoea sp. 1.19]
MNQAIQFPDREYWDGEAQAVCFPALVNGFQVTCAIAASTLRARYGEEQPALTLFTQYRWDLEEEAERAIQQEQYDPHGWVWLS